MATQSKAKCAACGHPPDGEPILILAPTRFRNERSAPALVRALNRARVVLPAKKGAR